MKNIYIQLSDFQPGKALPVLATVVHTNGSAPQTPGSSALFDDNGLITGTIGGGIVEKKIQEIAAERFINRKPGYFNFNLANDISRKEEAICGGQITILVDADTNKHISVYNQIKKSLSEKEPGVLLTFVRPDKDNTFLERYWMTNTVKPSIPGYLAEKAEPAVKEMLLIADRSGYCSFDLKDESGTPAYLFLEPVFPPLNLVIAGAGHIGKALAHLGRLTGFEVTVIDDRPEYANRQNIPDAANIVVNDVGRALREMRKGKDTYVVIVTRGHKDDAEALKACLGTGPAYIGMIGSRKKTMAMREEFINNDWATAEQWDEIFTPVGLEINARTVEEIAISIAAQLIQVRNSATKKMKGCHAL